MTIFPVTREWHIGFRVTLCAYIQNYTLLKWCLTFFYIRMSICPYRIICIILFQILLDGKDLVGRRRRHRSRGSRQFYLLLDGWRNRILLPVTKYWSLYFPLVLKNHLKPLTVDRGRGGISLHLILLHALYIFPSIILKLQITLQHDTEDCTW